MGVEGGLFGEVSGGMLAEVDLFGGGKTGVLDGERREGKGGLTVQDVKLRKS